MVDYYISLNGGVVYVIYARPAIPTEVGLAMSFHSVTVSYDNFTFIEIEP